MEHRTSSDPEHNLQSTGDELEERIDRLDDRIGEAHKEARARADDTDEGVEDVAGDVEDTEDESQGGDPASFDDPEALDVDEGEE
jgi:hypothetical protein